MYTYFYRIRDHHNGRPVSALAIFTGHDGDSMPARYSYEYRGTKLTYEYPTLSIRTFSDEELENSCNPFAQVIVAARIRLLEGKITEDQLLNTKITAAKKLLTRGFDTQKVRAIFTFLRNYILFEEPETNRKFDKDFQEADKTNVMNTIEYIKMEEREETVRRLLLDGLNLSIEKIATLANVSVLVVKQIKSELGIR